MLILTRRAGQSVEIGEDIVVTILSISDHQIRIGIEAPKDVAVHREEVAQRIRAGVPQRGVGHGEGSVR